MATVDFDGTELCFIAACVADRMEEIAAREARIQSAAAALGVHLPDETAEVFNTYQRIVAKLRDAMEREDLETGLSQIGVLLS